MKKTLFCLMRPAFLFLLVVMILLSAMGCDVRNGAAEEGLGEKALLEPLAVIDLGDQGAIEFVEISPGELVVGALLGSPDVQIKGIDESPLAVYRFYTGQEPPTELLAAYERSKVAQALDSEVTGSDNQVIRQASLAGQSKMTANEFESAYFNAPNMSQYDYKVLYKNSTALFRTIQNCFTLGIRVYSSQGTVRFNLKTKIGSSWSTEYTRVVPQGSTYYAYTGGVWRSRMAEVVESDNDIFQVMYFGMKKIFVCASFGGSSSTDIHPVVEEQVKAEGIVFNSNNWNKSSGDGVCSRSDADHAAGVMKDWAALNSLPRANMNLLVVGKSAGGVRAWYAFKRNFGTLDDFNKVALVFVDPHGSALGDGEVGTYSDDQSLTWPSSWSTNKSFFRVYNIYQHSNGLTGASFPSSNVYKNIKITGNSVSHDNIPGRQETKDLIREAVRFLKP
ncbi:MAG: hypothetical protein JXR70_01340 [Spirochaetales bacterium]|nr:hypothetical protein [Spirochaetales bacterium]